MKTRNIWIFCLAGILLIKPIMSTGQGIIEDSLTLDQVVITGSKQIRSAGNVTQRIDVLQLDEMQSRVMGNNNLSEALSLKPGMSVTSLSRNDANWGTYAGIGPKYNTYMLDGLPLDAFIDPQSLDLMAFERIEIQRGPASVLYPVYLSQDFAGNQSPLAGTINLIPREHISARETHVATSFGSYNTVNTQVFHQDAGQDYHYFSGVQYEHSDYTDYGTDGSWLQMKKDPEYVKWKVFAGANVYYGKDQSNGLSLFIHHTKHSGDAGRIYRGFLHDYTTANLSHFSRLSQSLRLKASVGLRVYDRNWEESVFDGVDRLVSRNGAGQTILPAEVNLGWKHAGASLLTVGADYQQANYNTFSDPLLGYPLIGNRSRAFQRGIYAQEELRLGKLTARGGLRYNYIRTTIDLINGSNPGTPVSDYHSFFWSGGLKFRISKNLNVFTNGGNSFLPPGLKSMGGTIRLEDEGVPGKNGQLPNPDLRPESGAGFDLGMDIRLPGSIRCAVRSFYLSIQDAIIDEVVSENPSQSRSINAGNSRSIGLELELDQSFGDFFQWFANYSYLNHSIHNAMDSDQDGAQVPFAPEHIINAGLSLKTGFGFRIDPVFQYNAGYYDSSSLSGRKMFTPGALFHLSMSQNVWSGDRFRLELFAKGYNLTNNRFEMPWQFRNTGLAISVGVKVHFQ